MAFTVKATIIKNDSISDYKTEVITLQPGDEQFLTEKEIVVEGEEIINLVPIDSPYVPNKKLSDTTYRFKFEITGQREIKLKQ